MRHRCTPSGHGAHSISRTIRASRARKCTFLGGYAKTLYWARTCCTRIGAAAARRPLKGYLSADSHQPLGRQASRRLLVQHVLAPYRICKNPLPPALAPSWLAHRPASKGRKGALDTRHASIIENLRDGLKGGRNGGQAEAHQVRPVWRARDGDAGGAGASVDLL